MRETKCCLCQTIIKLILLTSGYLYDLLYMIILILNKVVGQIYLTKHQLNKANYSDTEAPFWDLNLYKTNVKTSSKFMINGMILILK